MFTFTCIHRQWPALGVALALGGCASMAPEYERPASPLPTTYAAQPAPVDAAAGLPWRAQFTDPVLQGLIEQALARNHDARGAALRVQEAQAALGISRAEGAPIVGLGLASARSQVPADLSVTRQAMITRQHQVGVGFTSWELDFWGRVRSQNDAALARYAATESAQRATELLVITQVADAYLGLRELDARTALAEQALATRSESRRIFGRRVEVGATSKLEYTQVDMLWQQAQALLHQLHLQRRTQLHALALLVGEPGLVLPPSDAPLAALAPAHTLDAGLPSQLLARRPDIVAAEQALQAANAQIGVARALFFPRVALTAQGGTASAELDGLFSAGSRAWTFAPTIDLPLFDGGRRQANLTLTEVRRDQAVLRYEQAIESAFRDVADALAAREELARQLGALQATEAAQQERARLVQRRYDAGATRYFEVLDAERDLLAIQQQVVQAQRAQLSAQVRLYAALGGGSPTH